MIKNIWCIYSITRVQKITLMTRDLLKLFFACYYNNGQVIFSE